MGMLAKHPYEYEYFLITCSTTIIMLLPCGAAAGDDEFFSYSDDVTLKPHHKLQIPIK